MTFAMLGRTVIFAVGVVAAAVFLVPSEGPESGDANGLELSQPQQNSGQQQAAFSTEDWLAGDHTLLREADGHFYAQTGVNGTPVRMVVDTGASVIALTEQDAASIGLYWNEADIVRVGSGASGPVYGIHTVLDEVEVGGMTRQNVQAVIIPDGLGISLLGQSFLAQIGSVQIADDRMTLGVQ